MSRPVEAKTLVLRAYAAGTLLFELPRCGRDNLQPETLKVRLTLKATNGAILDGVDVIFDWLGYARPPAP